MLAWQDLIDHLDCGIAVFDAEGRFVLCNEDYRRLYPGLGDLLKPGVPFEALLRAAVDRGLLPQAAGREESFVVERLRAREETRGAILRQMADGHWRRITEKRVDGGYLVSFSVDVTEEVRKSTELESALDAARLAGERLEDAIEALPAGFELWDADDRLVACNTELRRMYPGIAHLLRPGAHWAELVRANLDAGGLKLTPEEVEQHVARRREQRQDGHALVQVTPDGRSIRILKRAARGGSVVAIRTDITEHVERERELSDLNERLYAARARLEELSETDTLTGIANRRRFDRRLVEEWSRWERYGTPLALLMIDVDHFKRFNDQHGHVAGDECLRRVAEVLCSCARRPSDLVARLGGEEFVLLLPNTDVAAAAAHARRCLESFDMAALAHGDSPVAPHVTVSVGAASTSAGMFRELHAFVMAADRALYRAKAAGRRRVAVA